MLFNKKIYDNVKKKLPEAQSQDKKHLQKKSKVSYCNC
jgi:hypothetical protein